MLLRIGCFLSGDDLLTAALLADTRAAGIFALHQLVDVVCLQTCADVALGNRFAQIVVVGENLRVARGRAALLATLGLRIIVRVLLESLASTVGAVRAKDSVEGLGLMWRLLLPLGA